MIELVVVDIGGTHARFALARMSAEGPTGLDAVVTLKAAEHASLELAWEAFAERLGGPPPRAAAIAMAGPIGTGAEVLQLTNNPWVLRPRRMAAELGLDRLTLVNDLGAVATLSARSTGRSCATSAGRTCRSRRRA